MMKTRKPIINPCTIFTMVLNNPAKKVEQHIIEEYRHDPITQEAALDAFKACVLVHENHMEDIRTGTSFMKLYVHYHDDIQEMKRTGGEFDLPTMREQAKGLLSSLTKVVRSNYEQVSEEEYKKRVETCASCPFLWPGLEDKLRCAKCGCFMRSKAKFAALRCPADKW